MIQFRTIYRRFIIIVFTIAFSGFSIDAQSLIQSRDVEIKFFSSAPLEDIAALSVSGRSVLNTESGEIYFEVYITSFEFARKLMKKHFNEQYLESAIYPKATFSGFLKDSGSGAFKISSGNFIADGELKIHGVTVRIKELVTLRHEGRIVYGTALFKVNPSDFDIKIPSILTKNIAEEIEVTVTVKYTQK